MSPRRTCSTAGGTHLRLDKALVAKQLLEALKGQLVHLLDHQVCRAQLKERPPACHHNCCHAALSCSLHTLQQQYAVGGWQKSVLGHALLAAPDRPAR